MKLTYDEEADAIVLSCNICVVRENVLHRSSRSRLKCSANFNRNLYLPLPLLLFSIWLRLCRAKRGRNGFDGGEIKVVTAYRGIRLLLVKPSGKQINANEELALAA